MRVPVFLAKIKEGAFFDCNNLILVNFGKDIKVIEKRAFYNTNLQGVDIPKTLYAIKEERNIHGLQQTRI